MLGFVVVAHGDDEGKPMLLDVGGVHRRETCALVICQRIETRTRLFRRALCRQALGRCQFARQFRVGRQDAQPFILRRRPEHPRQG